MRWKDILENKFIKRVRQNFKSKTFWVGVFTILTGVLTAIEAQLTAGISITFWGVVAIVVRNVTSEDVMEKKG